MRLLIIQSIFIGYLMALVSSKNINNEDYFKASDSCSPTNEYFLKTFNYSELLTPQRGNTLLSCQSDYTCCTRKMEKDLLTKTNQEFETQIKEKFFEVEVLLEQKYITADDFFVDLIENSKTASDVLLFKTYGKPYSDNSQPFMDLFVNLKNYYMGSAVDIEDIFDTFFTTLMQRVFKMLNPSYLLGDEYMQCISDNFLVIEPFEDMPLKLSTQIQRAFVAARTFVKGLEAGRLFFEKISKIKSDNMCPDSLMKIQHCSKCEGFISRKPCHTLCENVLNDCIKEYSELNVLWNEYVDLMQIVLERLGGPFNIESMLDPMDVKMSDAIMVLQNNKDMLTKTVFDICGQPKKDPNATYINMFNPMNLNFPGMGPGQENTDGTFSFHPFESFEYFDDIKDEEFVIDDDDDDLTPSSPSSRSTRSTKNKNNKKSKMHRSRKHNKREQDRDPDKTRGHEKSRDLSIREERFKQASHQNLNDEFEFELDIDESNREMIFATSTQTSIGTLVTEMKAALESMRNYWRLFPGSICDEIADKDLTTCWNKNSGSVLTKDETSVELLGETSQPHKLDSLVVFLRTTISELKMATHGYDPQLPHDQVGITTFEESSGDYSGSGEGSGFGEISPEIFNNGDSQHIDCPTCGGIKSTSLFLFIYIPSLLLTLWSCGL